MSCCCNRNSNCKVCYCHIFKEIIKTLIFVFLIIFVFKNFNQIKNYNYKYAFLTTGAVFKKICFENDPVINNYPGKVRLFWEHLKLLSKLGKDYSDKDFLAQNLVGYKIYFLHYQSLHVLFNEIFIQKEYFFESKNKSPIILDCGANIGMASLFFKKIYPDAKVICFEPVSKNFEILEKNIKENNLQNITLVKKALSDKKESIKLYNPGSLTGSLININSNNYEIVETELLSKYIDQKIDFLKMDIEGAETDVIQELSDAGKLKLIDQMIIEFHLDTKKNNLSKLLKNLEDSNFCYLISSNLKPAFKKQDRQDFLIYAYQK